MFERKSAEEAAERLLREKLYQRAVEEVEQGTVRSGLWGHALVEAEGNEDKAKARYLAARVQSMIDEQKVAEFQANEKLKAESDIEKKESRALTQRKTKKKIKSGAVSAMFVLAVIFTVFGFMGFISTCYALYEDFSDSGIWALLVFFSFWMCLGGAISYNLEKKKTKLDQEMSQVRLDEYR